ncbi:PQQ-binding-like beta-propeller repeat protein, partial [Verrucomicrobiota bacterium]
TCNLKPQSPSGVKGWVKFVKPVPPEIDEWTHFLHGADGNAVAQDTVVGPPKYLKWKGGPLWGRSHEEMGVLNAMVTSGGRLFYIMDEGSIASVRLPAKWRLVARDAFNGVVLWKREVSSWTDNLRPFRTGPAHLNSRVVAAGDVVYATLGLDQPVTALDAATGKTIRSYPGTEYTEEIIHEKGVLYLVVGTSEFDSESYEDREGNVNSWLKGAFGGDYLRRRGEPKASSKRFVAAVDAKTGSMLWKKEDLDAKLVLPLSLVVGNGKVYFKSTEAVLALDAKTGKQLWRTGRKALVERYAWAVPTVVIHNDVLLVSDMDAKDATRTVPNSIKFLVRATMTRAPAPRLAAYDANSGKELWGKRSSFGFHAPADLFVINDELWLGRGDIGYDLKTGEKKTSANAKYPKTGMSHFRCHRFKATSKYILRSHAGVEYFSVEDGFVGNNSWVRGTCQHGIVPANGLLYATPHACACFAMVKINGLNAIAAEREAGSVKREAKERLEKGPAFTSINHQPSTINHSTWPTYRGDAARTGVAKTKIPVAVKPLWQADIKGKLTQPVVSGGKLLVASIDEHTVYALDSESGKKKWSYTAGGRVDSAPTIYNGRAFFGCADGWLYAVDIETGKLAWRFNAAPENRRISILGQLESPWPLHGSVLIDDGYIYIGAGRSSFLDGGIQVYKLNPVDGKVMAKNVIFSPDQETGFQADEDIWSFGMVGTRLDVMTSDGGSIYMGNVRLDKDCKELPNNVPHLLSLLGFLDDTWFYRGYWMFGTRLQGERNSGFGGWPNEPRYGAPAGRILSVDADKIYGYGRIGYSNMGPWKMGEKDNSRMFSCGYSRKPVESSTDNSKGKRKAPPKFYWQTNIPIHVFSMVAGGKGIAVAGPLDLEKPVGGDDPMELENPAEALAALEGKMGNKLMILSPDNGKTISEYDLPASPVWDGMAVADGKIFISLKNGTVVCWE